MNTTDFDNCHAALNALFAEWRRRDADYQTRVQHLSGTAPGGLNAGFLLGAGTVHDDAAIDQLYGDAELDWFLYTATGTFKDNVNGLAAGEIASALT